jgi:RNA polymerase sigma-70 factor (ECF subfamily)
MGMKPFDAEALEQDIAAALAARDWARAATLALRGHGPHLLVYLRGVLHDEELVEEAFARFSEKVWRSLRDFRGEARFSTWLYQVAWYASKEVRRGLARRRVRRLATAELAEVAEEVRISTAAYLRTQARDRFAELRAQLDPEERSLLLLRVERRLSWKEVAAIMAEDGTPAAEAALRKRFERLRARLRQLFEEHGLR